jgi:hypothetical protein
LRAFTPSPLSRSTKNTRRPSLRGLEHARRHARQVGPLRVAVAQFEAVAVAPGPHEQQQRGGHQQHRPAVRSTGRTKRDRPTPPLNQITISLSRYMRPSVTTMATNSDRLSIVGRWPRAV